jgi:hypothetical protein
MEGDSVNRWLAVLPFLRLSAAALRRTWTTGK